MLERLELTLEEIIMWGLWLNAVGSGEPLKTKVGGTCEKQISWVELANRPKLGL